jgi:formiminotetrahydrofolate cyclodeaminase
VFEHVKGMKYMKSKVYTGKKRKELQRKIATALKDEMKTISKELQEILTDDLVTAFQNRMAIFTKIQAKKR